MKRKITVGGSMWLYVMVLAVGLILRRETEWLAILPAALLHEGGHYLAARLCGVRIRSIRLELLGGRMEMEGLLSYGKEFIIALGGPLVNFLCAGAIGAATRWELLPACEPLSFFTAASWGLGLLNLLPIGTMDGGRMLSAAISRLFSPEAARICLTATTTACLGLLWLTAAYALLRGAPVISAFVFVLILLLRYASPDGQRREI